MLAVTIDGDDVVVIAFLGNAESRLDGPSIPEIAGVASRSHIESPKKVRRLVARPIIDHQEVNSGQFRAE